jgi:hypothetical protein
MLISVDMIGEYFSENLFSEEQAEQKTAWWLSVFLQRILSS